VKKEVQVGESFREEDLEFENEWNVLSWSV
jgi:hypothetical protein